jgi:C1A family cysteine protease
MDRPKIGGYRKPTKAPAGAKRYASGKFDNLPPKVDLRKFMTDVEEQVGSSCVANALAGAYEYIAKRELQDESDVSRLFVYYNARYLDDMQDEDGGSFMETAIKGLQEYGACSETNWPNDEDLILQEPHEDAYAEAEKFKITDAQFIETDLDIWRNALAEGHPIAFALNTFESFDDASNNRGRVPMPKKSDKIRETDGWHAMLAVGYSDPDKVFIVRNSWGNEWGEKGYCYIPYDYIIHEDFNAGDTWIIKAIDESNYSEEVWDEDASSSFTDEDSTIIEDFYLKTGDPDGFLDELEDLLKEYTESEDDYFYDADFTDEADEDGNYEVTMLEFYLNTDDPDGFIEALEALGANYATDEESFEFGVAGEEDEEEEDDDSEEDEEEEDDDSEEEDSDEEEDSEEEEDDDEDDDSEEEEDDEKDEEEDDLKKKKR